MSFELRHSDTVAAILLLALAVGVFVASGDFRSGPTDAPGPAFFPRLIATSIALLAIVQIAQRTAGKRTSTHRVTRENVRRVGIPLAFVALYVATMPIFGFLVGTIVFLISFMWYSGVDSVRTSGPIALGISLLLFYVFVSFLHVPLPESSVLPISRLLPDLPLILGVFG
ncbi:tripartite tricarboxylate transporter TctB family protein [Halegenticoccus tardaugens]|uniref:tripartite tricarboxylate transporter TctB family protein n=1 Tax=Halegenticoccus tardaugens TaxID=2071624 RepID=UPI00100BBA4A|nr:tripartite tricarboxylate transporter TctB family protein [Halegenticoccus tardaugens]